MIQDRWPSGDGNSICLERRGERTKIKGSQIKISKLVMLINFGNLYDDIIELIPTRNASVKKSV